MFTRLFVVGSALLAVVSPFPSARVASFATRDTERRLLCNPLAWK